MSSSGRTSNLIHIANQKIEVLNTQLESEGINQLYSVPPENPTPKHIQRMVHDLDFMYLSTDMDEDDDLREAYVDARKNLMELKEHLKSKEETVK